jgi:hypothetical protein
MRLANLFLISISAFFSCQDETKRVYTPEEEVKVEKLKDSLYTKIKTDIALSDTPKVDNSPVLILSAKPSQKEYSNYKDITLSWKNVNGKTITGIRFQWRGLNAFGEPADMGGMLDGMGGGFTDETLKAGRKGYGTFGILSKDLKKVVKAWASEVAFEDGSKWKAD